MTPTKKTNDMKQKIMSYNEAKVFLKPLGLKSKEEYDEWWNANKPEFLPQFPEEYYSAVQKEETENPIQRTIDEVMAEIQEIIDNSHWIETRLSRLEASGYPIAECWVKNGSIGTIWYMKRKRVYRIQVADSEEHGDFHKAHCTIIPCDELSEKIKKTTVIRNLTK